MATDSSIAVRLVSLELVRIDGGTQVRASMKPETVLEYAEAMTAGAEFPAIIVFFDGDYYWCADGFHRRESREVAGFTDILCEVREGTLDDAKEYAASANADHGLRRTNADKRNAVAMILALSEKKFLDREIVRPWTPNWVAEKAKVTQNTVWRMLQEPGYRNYNLIAAEFLGPDGKLYPATRERAEPEEDEEDKEQSDIADLRQEVEEREQAREQVEAIAEKLAALDVEPSTIAQVVAIAEEMVDLEATPEELAETVREIRSRKRMANLIDDIRNRDPNIRPLPQDGKYNVIYADPPWRYDFSIDNNDAIEVHYASMELEDICALPVSDMAADDCTLFLWGTSPKLPEALQVMDAWGFTYKTSMIWHKSGKGMGYYSPINHEFLLIGTKGNPGVPAVEDQPESSVVFAQKNRHSEKPSVFHGHIEKMYPNAVRIEMFSRQERENWAAWGNEVNK